VYNSINQSNRDFLTDKEFLNLKEETVDFPRVTISTDLKPLATSFHPPFYDGALRISGGSMTVSQTFLVHKGGDAKLNDGFSFFPPFFRIFDLLSCYSSLICIYAVSKVNTSLRVS